MATNTKVEVIIKRFSGKGHFSKNDLLKFYLKSEPDLKDGTIRRRIDILKKRGIIQVVRRGIYSFQKKPLWIPSIDSSIKSIYKKLEKQYNDLNIAIWSTAWLSEFTNLQAFRHFVVIAVEKDFAESVFEHLKETGLKNLYFKPDKKEVSYYLGDAKETHIITTLITKSPVQQAEKIVVPKLEKILVDLLCDKDLFNAFQGSELKNIFYKAFDTYAINTSVLINYARRRSKENELLDFITKKLSIKLP